MSVFSGLWAVPLATLISLAAAAPPTPKSPRQIVDAFEKILQPRFQRTDKGVGIEERLFRVGGPHQTHVRLRADSPQESREFQAIVASGRRYFIGFRPVAHPPGDGRRRYPGYLDSTRYIDGAHEFVGHPVQGYPWKSLEERGLERAKRAESVDAEGENWWVSLRPVRAKAACLSCHKETKAGEALGILVYAVKKGN